MWSSSSSASHWLFLPFVVVFIVNLNNDIKTANATDEPGVVTFNVQTAENAEWILQQQPQMTDLFVANNNLLVWKAPDGFELEFHNHDGQPWIAVKKEQKVYAVLQDDGGNSLLYLPLIAVAALLETPA